MESLSQPNSVVLTLSRAQEYFGKLPFNQYLNRELIYNDSLHVRVSGIIKDYQGNTDFPYTDFISFSTISHSFLKQIYRKDSWRFNLGTPGIQAFAMLRKDADPGHAAAQFDGILQRHIANDPFLKMFKLNMILQPLSDVHFNAGFDHDGIRKANRSILYSLIGIGAFILLLAIINFINLTTAQSLKRARDIGIRRILGAPRLHLILRSLTETLIFITLSAIIALALVRPVNALFEGYMPIALPFNPFSLHFILFTAGIIILTTLLAGLYPAIKVVQTQFSRTTLLQHTRKLTLRRALVVFQFSISLLFIIASLVVGQQVKYMLSANMGFNSRDVITISGANATSQQLQLYAREASDFPGVIGATVQSHPPASEQTALNPMYLDQQTDHKLDVYIQDGDQNFIPMYHIRLLVGRNLQAGDSLRGFVINDTYRRALGFSQPTDALGHYVTWREKSYPIVGVVADFHTTTLHDAIPPLIIGRMVDIDNSIGLRLSPGDLQPNRSISQLGALWKNLFPNQSFNYTFLDESL
ncbi:MAG: ABC transporter permease, partial [Bacteroidota bacterium]|nr:ABC transporter permease [Bacteroidota bacterium]